jgi:hypothetical protein
MHTEGPWEAKRLDANHFMIQCKHGSIARTTVPFGRERAEMEANAKVLAAAPTLLTTARLVVQRAAEHGLLGHDLGDLRNAVATLEAAVNVATKRT